MKKIICILLIFSGLIIIIGCENNTDNNINFINESEYDMMTGVTYKFIGKSEHFSFHTGKVYYDEETKEIFISNFKLIKEIKNIESYSLNVYFYNNPLLSNEKSYVNSEELDTKLKNTVIAEYGKANSLESSAFSDTTKENFKDSIKITVEYCYKNLFKIESCKKEKMEISYIENDMQ